MSSRCVVFFTVAVVAAALVICLLGLFFVTSSSTRRVIEHREAVQLPAGPRWKDVAPPSFLIGGVLHGYGDKGFFYDRYREHIAATEFNSITATMYYGWNAWDFQIDPDTAFAGMDAVTDWAIARERPVHGHVLVYPQSTKDRYQQTRSITDAEIRTRLQAFVTTTAARYAGRVHVWDVANEVLGDDGDRMDARGLRTHWKDGNDNPVREYHALPSYVEQAFVWTREQDPSAVLILNDYGVGVQNAKSDRYLAYAMYLKTIVPIDGVGFQMHWMDVNFTPSVEAMRQNMQRFADQGLRVFVTELDVVSTRSGNFPSDAEQARQRKVFANVLEACLLVAACEACWLWDFADDVSWLGPETYATPFWDRAGGPGNAKPSYYGIQSTLDKYHGSYLIQSWWEPSSGYLGRHGEQDATGTWVPTGTAGTMAYSPPNFEHLRFVVERVENRNDEFRLRSLWTAQRQAVYLTHNSNNQVQLLPLDGEDHRQQWILEKVQHPNRELGTGDPNEQHTDVYRLRTRRGLYLTRSGREVSPGIWEALSSVSVHNGKDPRWLSQLWTMSREQ